MKDIVQEENLDGNLLKAKEYYVQEKLKIGNIQRRESKSN